MSSVIIYGDTGTNFRSIGCDINGNMNVNVVSGGGGGGGAVQIQDSNGNDLLGTNDALDVNIKGVDLMTVGTETGLAVNVLNTSLTTHMQSYHSGNWIDVVSASNGHLLVNSSTQDGTGNDITSTATTTSIRSLDTSSTLYAVNGTTRTAITSTGNNLNVNVANTVPVSGTFYQATQPVSIAGTVSVSGSFYQATQPVSIASTVQVNQVLNKLGDTGNMISSAPLISGASSSYINVSAYGKNCLITYQDGNPSSLNTIFVVGTTPLSSPINVPILKLSPTKQPNTNYRYAYAYVDLSPFQEIRLYNESSETLINVYCSVMSG